MLIKHIFPFNDVSWFNKNIYLFIFNVFDIRHQMTAKRFSFLFIGQSNISCNIFIHHALFPCISISLNTFMFNLNIIFNILHISHDLLNDSKQFFLFISLYFIRDIQRGGDTEQQFHRMWYAVSLIDVYRKRSLVCYFHH